MKTCTPQEHLLRLLSDLELTGLCMMTFGLLLGFAIGAAPRVPFATRFLLIGVPAVGLVLFRILNARTHALLESFRVTAIALPPHFVEGLKIQAGPCL